MRKIEQREYINNITTEDKALFRALCETYDYPEIDRYFHELESLNENYFVGVANPKSYSGETPGTTEKGLKGAVKALPSFVISCLLCPAGTIIALIGAVRSRFEKKFTKSLLNLSRWADFVGTEKGKQELVEKVKREVAEKTKYYMAKLANGEVIRVVACHNYEAKQMAMAIEDELIIPQEENFTLLKNPDPAYKPSETDKKERDDSNDKIWAITFDDGEVQYWQANKDADKKQIIEEANKQRRFIAGSFAKNFKKVTGKKLAGVGSSYDKEYEPIKTAVVDKIEIIEDASQLKKITEYNKENIEIYEGDRLSVNSNFNNNNAVKFGLSSKEIAKGVPMISYALPTVDKDEMKDVTSKFFTADDGYYKTTFIPEYKNYVSSLASSDSSVSSSSSTIPDSSTKTYTVGTYAFGRDCTINLVHDSSNNFVINGLIRELSQKFKEFLENNDEIETSTKKKLEKYTFDQKTENAINSNPLIRNKKLEYSGPFITIPELIDKNYPTAFEYAILSSPDDEGNNVKEEVKLRADAA